VRTAMARLDLAVCRGEASLLCVDRGEASGGTVAAQLDRCTDGGGSTGSTCGQRLGFVKPV
jgi:hypothetical protein